jgi:drug/metabolite transporter (DMT)-like permease
MGRFEKQPDNQRGVRGDLSRAAENALWAVVEDLENLQQHVLRSLQEEVKRLQAEKNRLHDDIQRLVDEKEQLQQARQISEQQVLIRQLAEALAKHISSQLQSSLSNLANKAIETQQINNNPSSENNENVEKLLGSLDDTLTITFNSLQQDLKNYQSNLSQQLSRMYSDQQQGEYIISELINRLQGLEKIIAETQLKATPVSPPTVLQLTEEPQPTRVSPPTVLQFPQQQQISEQIISQAAEPLAFSPTQTTSQSQIAAPIEATFSPESENVISPELPESETTPEATFSTPFNRDDSEPISVLSPDFSESETAQESTFAPPEATPPPVRENFDEPISLFSPQRTEKEPQSEPALPPRPQTSKPPSLTLPGSNSLSSIQIGFLLIVLSSVVSALYNVAVKVIFHQGSEILGVVQVERLLLPTLGNTLLILMLRLLVVVPLMLLLAPMMHPRVWEDLQTLFTSVRSSSTPGNSKTRKILQLSIASGCFLFLSQVLIYIAISQVTTGMAIALFFIYPVISGLLSWFLFRDRPSGFRNAAIGAVFCGELLILGGASGIPLGNIPLGSTTAIFAGVAFAVYVILTRICASKLHPVSFTVINFATMLLLSFIGLLLPLPADLGLVLEPSRLLEIVLSAFILGVLTLFGYVVNNVGIRKLGAPRSAIIGASVPFLTVIFAGLLIQENLEFVQILGVLLVTFGAAAFSFDKVRNQVNPSSPT